MTSGNVDFVVWNYTHLTSQNTSVNIISISTPGVKKQISGDKKWITG